LGTRSRRSSNLSGINEFEGSDDAVGKHRRSSKALRTMGSMVPIGEGVEPQDKGIIESQWNQ
jgi:hypothetical protein